MQGYHPSLQKANVEVEQEHTHKHRRDYQNIKHVILPTDFNLGQ